MRHNGRIVSAIAPTARLVAARDRQLSTTLAGEVVILDVEGGVYFGLDGVGAKIWELLQAPRSISEIIELLAPQYDVARDIFAADVQELLEDLAGRGLIEVDPATGS
jgi:hypothetical protein